MTRIARALPFVLALGLAACGGGGDTLVGASPLPPGGGTDMSAQELDWAQQVFALTNVERQNQGLPALAWDDGAAEVAYRHSLDMDVRNYFDHVDPDGLQPWDRLTAAGISWSSAGENIAYGYDSPDSVMTAWMNSSGHRANILRAGFTRLGVGVHSNGTTIWWTQLFYTP